MASLDPDRTASVDVIVPCYRYGHFLEECVGSILAQAGVGTRAIVIDDASPDGSAEVGAELARRHEAVTFVRHAANKGAIATYNEGIEWAEADYLLLLSADDALVPDTLRFSTELMDRHPEVGFSFGNCLSLFEDGSLQLVRPLGGGAPSGPQVFGGETFIRRCGATNIVPTPTAVVRTTLQKRLGGYLPELPHSGDMEMWFRLAAHGSVGFTDETQGVYRRHDRNMSQGYDTAGGLPDLQQRKLAIDLFVERQADALANPQGWRGHLYRDLARVAVTRASSVFNTGDLSASRNLSSFAATLDPRLRTSLPWLKLGAKRLAGPRGWRLLQGALSSARGKSSVPGEAAAGTHPA
ncbi:glycosyltransferase family 2 protein [Aureimonas sp. AU40]|uniref:glycosyltransferase family 2 protein n=1 Tax=Aureimonas sp. AU40 TaxID=1637747 RepID=UPI00078598BE|nr:glycosyltransferase family 2 protein [Aureimonas sp. AU40]